ncbi:MAG TPA: DUF4296 domain-containing protein, partial [Bacteroidia bacterium]|nr:DUF4296 domain-containing protein [Bacteroidia bacterium]
QEKMEAVLWDVIQADAFTNLYIKKDTSKNPSYEDAKLLSTIFAIHKISKDDFYKSYEYYKNNPTLMLTVLDSISVKESRAQRDRDNKMYPVNNNHVIKPDSIKQKELLNRKLFFKQNYPSLINKKP